MSPVRVAGISPRGGGLTAELAELIDKLLDDFVAPGEVRPVRLPDWCAAVRSRRGVTATELLLLGRVRELGYEPDQLVVLFGEHRSPSALMLVEFDVAGVRVGNLADAEVVRVMATFEASLFPILGVRVIVGEDGQFAGAVFMRPPGEPGEESDAGRAPWY